jgi:Fur family transcriptional regulator, stress-responsive regulator
VTHGDPDGTGAHGSAADAAALLRRAGLRATQPRLRVLNWLADHDGHHAAESIGALAEVPKATAYHVLGQLVDAGLVLTTTSRSGSLVYETASTPHHHFLCTTCGRIIDVPCAVGAEPCIDAEVPGVTVDRADIQFSGRCDGCAASTA